MQIFTIYKATCALNGKSYIGFDSHWPNREEDHKFDAKSGSKLSFHRAIRKHGIDNFAWSVVYQSKDRDHTLNVMEPFFIAESNSFVGDSGYNMTMGGEGSIGAVRSDEFKMKLSKLHTGRTWSKESVEKSAASKRGIPRSDETKEKLSAANIGKKWSDETKAKWIASRKGKPWSAETRAKRLTNKMNGISHVEGL